MTKNGLIVWRFGVMLLLQQVLTFGFYLLSAKLGLELATINAHASPVWPATGVAVSLLYLFGYRAGWAIWLGAFIANSGSDLTPYSAAMIATGNTLEAMAALFLLRRGYLILANRPLYHARLLLYSLAAIVPTLFSATLGTAALMISGLVTKTDLAISFTTWWLGDGLGLLLVFPLFYELLQLWKKITSASFVAKWPTLKTVLSWGGAGLLLFLCSHMVFGTLAGNAFLFLVFFGLLMVVLVSPYWMVYVAALWVSGYSIWMTNKGIGPFRSIETNESLLHLEFFLASVWLTAIVLSNLKSTGLSKKVVWTFSIGWLLTGATFFSFYEFAVRRATMNFEAKASQATSAVKNAMDGYIRLLEAGASFLNSSQLVTAQEWKQFTAGLNFSDRYPGLKGLGVNYAVDENKVKDFEKKYALEQPDFKVHDFKGASPIGIDEPTQKHVIVYIEPRNQNLPALGFNIGSEPIRYEAIARARDNNQAALTRDIRLQQSKDAGPGYLLLLPFFQHSADTTTVMGRRKGLRGFVSAPLEGEIFFKHATGGFEKELALERFETIGVHDQKFENTVANKRVTEVTLAGVPFRLHWQNKTNPVQGGLAASVAGFCGAFFTLVLAILVASLEGLGNEAHELAKQMTEEVRERERRWRALTETSPAGVFLSDENSRLTYVNQRWMTITGLSVEDMRSGKLREAMHPEDVQRVYADWDQFIKGLTSTYECNYRINVHGKWRHVFCHAIEVKSDEGVRVGFLGTLQDLTDLHANQAALATASRLSSLGQMAGGIAHEINTPLAVISTKVDLMRLLLQKPDINRDKFEEQLSKIQDTVHRIAKIVQGLKSIAREPSEEKPVLFPLHRAIADTLELSEKRFLNAGVTLSVINDLKEDISVWGHPEQISQVILNLLNNSFDAVKELPEKWVQIRCSTVHDFARIEVSDAGHSLLDDVRQSLFNPFFTTKKAGEGTGLGLSISRALIEKCGGKLYFDGNRSNTTFVIELPLANKGKTYVHGAV